MDCEYCGSTGTVLQSGCVQCGALAPNLLARLIAEMIRDFPAKRTILDFIACYERRNPRIR